jgi:hypothetical protein
MSLATAQTMGDIVKFSSELWLFSDLSSITATVLSPFSYYWKMLSSLKSEFLLIPCLRLVVQPKQQNSGHWMLKLLNFYPKVHL